jgi:hypothetical protein
MEENATGTTSNYNTNNYTQVGNAAAYVAPAGTTITPASVYTNPSTGCDTFV